MKEKLIYFLKRLPPLYRFIRNLYWKLLGLKARILGTRIEERRWAKRNLNQIQKGFSNLNHPHRQFLVKKISTFRPFSSILEIGCGYGPNLYWLAKQFPDIELVGIDINPLSIREGNKFLMREAISNVKLIWGKVDELDQFQDKSFDIVFTDALLIYIGPDKIKKVIREMVRISRRALILVELHHEQRESSENLGIYYYGYWLRNYVDLLKEFVPKDKIRLTKIPKELWGGNWEKLGYIIEVTI